MKTLKKIALTLIILGLGATAIYAQDDLEQQAKQRAQECVSQLNDCISFMADKDKSLNDRKIYKKEAAKLFIANLGPYDVGGITKKTCYMQTMSTYRKTVKTKPMLEYFDNVINLRYAKVDIESTDTYDIRVSELKLIDEDEGLYQCTAYFDQAFKGYSKEGRPIYGDKTRKKVTCYVIMFDIDDSPVILVLLGDVKVDSIRKL